MRHSAVLNVLLDCEAGRRLIASPCNGGWTSVHLAVRLNSANMTQSLLQHQEGRTALAQHNNLNIITPVDEAARNNCRDTMRIMLQHSQGRDALTMLEFDETAPLHHAVKHHGDTRIADMILQHDRGIESMLQRDRNGRTPLHEAASRQDASMSRRLLESTVGRKALSMQTTSGRTPLHEALSEGQDTSQTMHALLAPREARSVLSMKDCRGRHLCIRLPSMGICWPARPFYKALLIRQHCLSQTRMVSRWSCWACRHEDGQLLEILLRHSNGRASLDMRDDRGFTAMHEAAFLGHAECLKLMLKHDEGQRLLCVAMPGALSPMTLLNVMTISRLRQSCQLWQKNVACNR